MPQRPFGLGGGRCMACARLTPASVLRTQPPAALLQLYARAAVRGQAGGSPSARCPPFPALASRQDPQVPVTKHALSRSTSDRHCTACNAGAAGTSRTAAFARRWCARAAASRFQFCLAHFPEGCTHAETRVAPPRKNCTIHATTHQTPGPCHRLRTCFPDTPSAQHVLIEREPLTCRNAAALHYCTAYLMHPLPGFWAARPTHCASCTASSGANHELLASTRLECRHAASSPRAPTPPRARSTQPCTRSRPCVSAPGRAGRTCQRAGGTCRPGMARTAEALGCGFWNCLVARAPLHTPPRAELPRLPSQPLSQCVRVTPL